MRFHLVFIAFWAVSPVPGVTATAAAQSPQAPIPMVVETGRTIEVALERRITVKHIGQPVTATLMDPIYVYDRIVVAAGTKVLGRIEQLEGRSKKNRLRSMLAGDYSSHRRITVAFDRFVMPDGQELLIQTAAADGIGRVVLRVAAQSERKGIVSRTREEIVERAEQLRAATAPGKGERLRDMAIRALPYHPQFVSKGTVYRTKLTAPLDFGDARPIPRATPGAVPSPDTVIDVRLVTPLRSGSSVVGSRVEAVLTRPVLSEDRRLILPAGSKVAGEVTRSKRAAYFHRHGQLRFVFSSFEAQDRAAQDMSASLFAVESAEASRVTLDDEGGASSASPKVRMAAPALAALALVGSLHGRLDYDTDGAGPEMQYGGTGSSAVGGFLGFGILGVSINQLGRPFTVATASVGLAQTVYSSVFAKGREVAFPEGTPIQLRLAPRTGPSSRTP